MKTSIKTYNTTICAIIMILGLATAKGGNIIKADDANVLTDPASWVGGVVPTSLDVAIWDNTVQVNTTSALGADTNWAGIKVLNPAGPITISSGNVLTLGVSGVDLSLANQGLTMACPVILAANQPWAVSNGLTLSASGVVSGTNALTLGGGGTISLSGANTYSGGTTINGGIVEPNNATCFGAAAANVTNNSDYLLFDVFPNGGIIANRNYVNGKVTVDMFNRAVSVVLDGAWAGSGTIFVTNLVSGATLTLGGNGTGGDMGSFTGTVVVADTNSDGNASAGSIRFNNGGSNKNVGNSNAVFNLGQGSAQFTEKNGGVATFFGALIGGPNTSLSKNENYVIGGANLDTTFAGTIQSSSTVTKVGTGTLRLTGNNPYTGSTTVSGGTLQFGDGITPGTGTPGTGAIVNNATLIFNRPDSMALANTISGSGTLIDAGAGIITLTAAGTSTFSGPMIVTNNGTVQVGAAGALSPATSLILGGSGTAGTLDLFGNNAQVSALNTGSGATASTVGSSGGSIPTILTVNATNGDSTFSGVIRDTLPAGGSGNVALVVQNGKITLTGPNTYTGSTTISNGTLVVGAGGTISTSPTIALATPASVLDVSVGGLSLASGYNLSGNGAIAGAVTAAGAVINPATNGTVGTLTFSNSLALTGGNTVHFDLSSFSASGNDQVVVVGALNLSGLNTIEIAPLTILNVGTYKLFIAGSVSGSLANLQLSGSAGPGLAAALSVSGTEVDLVVTSTTAPLIWNGDSSLNQWNYTTQNWSSNGAPALFADSTFTVFNDAGSHSPMVDITAPVSPVSVTVNSSGDYTFGSVSASGKISGLGALTKTNSGKLTLLTPNDYIGGTFIGQGTVQVGNGAVSGAALGNGPVIDNASLIFNQPDNYDFTNVISGTGTLTQSGTATLSLSGSNTYSGTTLINSGTLQVGDGATSGKLGTNTVIDNAALAFNRSDSVVQDGQMTGTGTVAVVSGTVAVTASNDLTGVITINPSTTLQLGNGGPTGTIVMTNLVNSGTLAFDHSVDETNSLALTGTGGVAQVGTNVLTFTGANSYNGDTTISSGTLKIGASGTLPSGPGFGNVVLNGGAATAGILDINGHDTVLNGINGSSNAVPGRVVNNSGTATNVLTIGAGDATTTFGGIVANNTGTGGIIQLVKTGTGTFTLGSSNSYTGGTIISNGILALGNDQANNSGGLSGVGPTNVPVVFAGGTLQLFGFNGSTSPNYNSFYNPLVVPAGQTGTLQMFSRGPASGNPGLGSSLTGAGTLNLVVNYVRGSLDGDWSAFTGVINVTPKPAGGDEFRINNRFGYANAAIILNDGVTMDRASGTNPTNDIGDLAGTSAAVVGPGNSSTGNPTWRVGSRNGTATFAGSIRNDGVTSIIKVGTGTWILSGANTYTGSTIISAGVLALGDGVTDGTIDSSTNINIASDAILDVSRRSDGTLQLGQTLSGSGTVRGSVNVNSGAVLSPGTANATGTLTVTNVATLSGTAWMKLNRGSVPNSDLLVAPTINLGGTLVLTNIGAPLHVGDTFTLFQGTLAGTFASIITPNYYTFNTTQVAVNGTVTVTSYTPPTMTADYSAFSSGVITFNAAGGIPGNAVSVLSSTNLSVPLTNWTAVATGNFAGDGSFTAPVTVDTTIPSQFYILSAQ